MVSKLVRGWSAIKSDKRMDCDKELIIVSLTKFFRIRSNLDVLLRYISHREDHASRSSLRVIDWFVTNYAKHHNTSILKSDGKYIYVYSSYRSQLKAYTKHQFDPFRRKYRINYYYDDVNFVETTIGQMNFFRWLIENEILQYIELERSAIEHEMMTASCGRGGGDDDEDCKLSKSKKSEKSSKKIHAPSKICEDSCSHLNVLKSGANIVFA